MIIYDLNREGKPLFAFTAEDGDRCATYALQANGSGISKTRRPGHFRGYDAQGRSDKRPLFTLFGCASCASRPSPNSQRPGGNSRPYYPQFSFLNSGMPRRTQQTGTMTPFAAELKESLSA